MNEILDTQLGTAALQGLDSTAAIADKLIDQYFPATVEEEDRGTGMDDRGK